MARKLLGVAAMSSFEAIYKKMLTREQSMAGDLTGERKFDPAKHVSPAIAHELNNLLTVIQGHADRMLLQNAEKPALTPHLKVILEATQRATAVVRGAMPSAAALPKRNLPQPQPSL